MRGGAAALLLAFLLGCAQPQVQGLAVLGGADWCVPGQAWQWPGARPASAPYTVQGLSAFQGAAYCLASAEDGNGSIVQYLFLEGQADVWRRTVSPDGNAVLEQVTADGVNWYG